MATSPTPAHKPLISLMKLLTLAACVLFLAAPGLKAQRSLISENNLSISEQYLLAAANEARANEGLPPVHLDPVLAAAAVAHAREMANHAAISHQFNGEPELAERAASAGVRFSFISENVAEAPTSVVIHDLWMHSPHHRANLLDPKVNSIGIAVVARNRQLFAVEDFASSVQSLTLNQQERVVGGILARSGMKVSETTEDARQTCTMDTGYAGSRQPWFVMRYTASSLNEIPSQLKTRLNSGKYHQAVVGACSNSHKTPFTSYNIAVLLYP